ncbi:hypothetical protein [Mucilaginibacter sp.]|nr:hypothetical protein [Mucilaginibacter sp.]
MLKGLKKLTKEQENILSGLKQLSDEAAGFFQDALLIMDEDCLLTSKVNLVAHLTREIDSTFRKIFAPKEISDEHPEAKEGRGNYASILVAMGVENKQLADEWFSIAKQFPSFAHRHGLKTRTLKEFNKLWTGYEKILNYLLGSQYAFLDRIAHLVGFEEPTKEMLGTLPYFLKDINNQFQFYKSLDKTGWLLPLYEQGFFKVLPMGQLPSEPGTMRFPEWMPLRYLANIAGKADEKQEELIIKIIRELQAAVIKGNVLLDENSIYLVTKIINDLPNYLFQKEDSEFLIAFGNYWPIDHVVFENVLTEDLIEKYVKMGSAEGVQNVLNFTFGYRKHDLKMPLKGKFAKFSNNRVIPNTRDANHWFLKQNLKEVIALTGLDLVKQLADILKSLGQDYSYEVQNIPSIEDSEQRTGIYGDWSYQLIDIVSLSGELLQPGDKKELVSFLMGSDSIILHRIAFHLIRSDRAELISLFWDYIQKSPLSPLLPLHELYLLLTEISSQLSVEELNFILSWLETIKVESEHLSEQERNDYRIYRIQRYLFALHPEGGEQQGILKVFLEKYGELSPENNPHPEYDSYSTFSHGYEVPDDAGELEKLTVQELVDRLAAHKKKDKFDFSVDGLGLLVINYIIGDPAKFIEGLPLLMTLPLMFIKSVFNGFATVAKNGDLADWKAIINVFLERINQVDFREEANARYADEVGYQLADFILNVSEKDDQYHFKADELEYLAATAIGLLELEQIKNLDHIDKDFVNYQLNTMEGKLYAATINISRLWSQQLAEGTKHRLPPPVSDYLERNLSRTSEKGKAYSLGLGYHFAFVLYAEKAWCYKNADAIFPDDRPLHKDYTLSNLFSPYTSIYKNVVEYLRETGLNAYAVKRYITDTGELAKLCKYALVDYFDMSYDPMVDAKSLIFELVTHREPLQFEKLVAVCCQLGSVPQERLLALWKILAKIAATEPDKYAQVLNDLPRLCSLVNVMDDEVFELLELSVPYLKDVSPTYFLVKDLLDKPYDHLEKTGSILLKIWKQSGIHVFVTDELKQFVERLYTESILDVADEICHFVAARGDLGLKAIYDNYKLSQFK